MSTLIVSIVDKTGSFILPEKRKKNKHSITTHNTLHCTFFKNTLSKKQIPIVAKFQSIRYLICLPLILFWLNFKKSRFNLHQNQSWPYSGVCVETLFVKRKFGESLLYVCIKTYKDIKSVIAHLTVHFIDNEGLSNKIQEVQITFHK